MTQIRNAMYRDMDTAQLHNNKFARVITAGVYKGYKVRVSSAGSNKLDITKGSDGASVLITEEGVRIEETDDLISAVSISAADSTERRDLVVAEYQYVASMNTTQTYKVLKGKAAATGATPVVPTPGYYQVPLAVITVPARTAVSGVANITDDDVLNVLPAEYIPSDNIGSLKCVVDFNDTARLYVYPGKYPTIDGTAYVDFIGGYSSDLVPGDFSTSGETRYFLFGISDDQDISYIHSDTTKGSLETFDTESMPLCIATARYPGAGTDPVITEVTDVRFPFMRRMTVEDETQPFLNLLADSIFEQVRVDTFHDSDMINLSSITLLDGTTAAYLSARINPGDSSLVLTASSVPTQDVIIKTENIFGGSSLTNIRHFMVTMNTNIVGLTFDYTTTADGIGGWRGVYNQLNDIISVPAPGANNLYLKFRIPSTDWSATIVDLKIFGYGVYVKLDNSTTNTTALANMPLNYLDLMVPNLIANGDFYYFTQDTINNAAPDLGLQDEIQVTCTSDHPIAGDGWQITRWDYALDSDVVSRVIIDKEVYGTTGQEMGTGLKVTTPSGGTQTEQNYLEYRIPIADTWAGQKVSFAIDYSTDNYEGVGIRIALYKKDNTTYTVQNATEYQAFEDSGRIIVRSSATIGSDTYAIGFIVVLKQLTAINTTYVWNATAAIGTYNDMTYSRPPASANTLAAYYERGKVYNSGRLKDGDSIGMSLQFAGPKNTELGTLVVQPIQHSSANRSVDVGSITFAGQREGFTVQGVSLTTGHVVLDLDWEAYVLFTAAV